MKKFKTASYDRWLIALYFLLLLLGWFIKVAATPATSWNEVDMWGLHSLVGVQSFWTVASLLFFLSVFLIERKFWNVFSLPIYLGSLLLLVLVLIFGVEVNGAKAWLNIGGFSIQPVEFAKFATCLSLSNYLANPSVKVNNFRSMMIALLIIGLPILLLMFQPDVGSALVFLALGFIFFRNGVSIWPFITVILLGVVFVMTLSLDVYRTVAFLLLLLMFFYASQFKMARYWILSIMILATANIVFFLNDLPVLILIFDVIFAVTMTMLSLKNGQFRLVGILTTAILAFSAFSYTTSFTFNNILKPHQQDRLNVWLHPERCDPRGSLYNVLLSRMSISSGGFEGKGYMKGTLTKLNYVPEHTTDFIFCIVGEEQGFIGSALILFLFLFLILRVLFVAEKSETRFVTNFGYGFAGFLFFHVFINIGMTIGLVPVIGIPLPFISYGGSSLLSFTLMYAVFVNISKKSV